MDAAYRYTRHASGGDVIMFGTGNPDHLEKNVASLTDPPLKNEALARLDTLFGDGRAVGVKSAKIYGLP